MRLSDSAQGPALVVEDIREPHPRRGELLVQIHAAGLTPTELRWYPTTHNKEGKRRSGAVPGHEFSGVIAAVGADTPGFHHGQEIYGMNDWFADGAIAEYCITQPTSVASKPRRLTHIEAAAVPIGALTAWQGLFDRAQLQAGEHVLVHGGAGAVGSFAVQLARFRGAHVTATASARNLDFVSGLGAERVIDYQAARFEETVSGMDAVFDTVGGETALRSRSVLKPSGRMITIAADIETTADDQLKRAFFIVEPNREQLTRIGELLEAADLHPVVDAVVPLSQAPAAYAGEVTPGLGRGKLVVAVTQTT
jgi:NADPH:quinone reductase-like Zn-dependent oxidoreductase